MPIIKQTWEHSSAPPPRRPKQRTNFATAIGRGLFGLLAWLGRAADSVLRLTDRFSPRRLVSFVIMLGFFGGLLLLLAVVWYSRDLPDPNRLIDKPTRQSTQILDRTGSHVLYEIFDEQKRSLITLPEIPRAVIAATLTAEDRDFYNHRGFDLSGIVRAAYKDLTRARKAQGASTITQQLIKNAILTREKTFGRKIRELILAWRIEQKFTKDQILQLYFNEIPYGSNVYGVETAAQTFFGKSVRAVSLAEAALLAAVPKAPTYYSPFGTHTADLIARQRGILRAMAELGKITPEDAARAEAEPVLQNLIKQRTSITAPHFVFFVRDLLTQQFGEQMIDQGGLKVITTLDLDKQKLAEKAIADRADYILKTYNATNAALVSLDVPTGDIVAMVGSKDYFDAEIDGQVNVTLQPRQPGSSFKPVVYALAFERGFTPQTATYDVDTVFKNYPKDYQPRNYDGKEHGIVSLRTALAGSLNIPAVQMLSMLGTDNVLDRAQQLGYTTLNDRSRFGLALVLGGGEVKLLEHANAYAAFARGGQYQPYRAILKVTDGAGNILLDQTTATPLSTPVFDEQAVLNLTSVLSDNNARSFIFGQNNSLILPDRAVAAKTGSTNDFRDAWTMGYTPSLVTGVWAGNNNNTPLKNSAGAVAAPIWQQYMKAVTANTPVEQFKIPETRVPRNPYLTGLAPGEELVRLNRLNGKRAVDTTPSELISEQIYRTGHSILQVIDPTNPDGPPPTDPSKNPQYENWEKAVRSWYERQRVALETPPTEFDNGAITGTLSVTINQPTTNATIREALLPISVQYSPTDNATALLYVNNLLLASVPAQPTMTLALPPGLDSGFYTLRVVIQDANGQIGQASVPISMVLPQTNSTVSWLTPAFGATISRAALPLAFKLTVPDMPAGSSADFSVRSINSGTVRQIARQNDLSGNTIQLDWTGPADLGTQAISVRIIRPGQENIVSPELYFTMR